MMPNPSHKRTRGCKSGPGAPALRRPALRLGVDSAVNPCSTTISVSSTRNLWAIKPQFHDSIQLLAGPPNEQSPTHSPRADEVAGFKASRS